MAHLSNHRELLEMALLGLQVQHNEITQRMLEIRQALDPTVEAIPFTGKRKTVRSHISAAGRKAISQAQKKRWAEHHREQKKRMDAADRRLHGE